MFIFLLRGVLVSYIQIKLTWSKWYKNKIKMNESDSQLKSYLEDIEHMNSLFSKSSVVELVLKNLLIDSFGSTQPQPINSDTVRTILTTCGEPRLLEDEQLIDDMVLDLSGGDPNAVLDVESFSRALSNDILLYDVKKEISLSTYLHDVFGDDGIAISVERKKKQGVPGTQDATEGDNDNVRLQSEDAPLTNGGLNFGDDPEKVPQEKKHATLKNTFTCSQVDFLADGCRSKGHLIMAYCLFILTIFQHQNTDYQPDGLCGSSSMGCSIAKKTMRWLVIMTLSM